MALRCLALLRFLCPSCGTLVGVNDRQCLSCGRLYPGMWGLSRLLRNVGDD
jgi:hypothetical protein